MSWLKLAVCLLAGPALAWVTLLQLCAPQFTAVCAVAVIGMTMAGTTHANEQLLCLARRREQDRERFRRGL